MEISWLGHSCFRIKGKQATVITDPYPPDLGYSLGKLTANIVTVSHQHPGHSYVQGINSEPRLITGPGEYEISGVLITGIATFHDQEQGRKRGKNTVYLMEVDEVSVCHLGDLGHVLEESQLEQIGSVDVLMIPVDGYFTIDIDTAKTIISQLAPKIVFPMHYRTERLKTTGPIYTEEDIVNGFKNVKKLEQSHLVVDNEVLDQEQQIIILDYLKFDGDPYIAPDENRQR